jgi:hypothetical protein
MIADGVALIPPPSLIIESESDLMLSQSQPFFRSAERPHAKNMPDKTYLIILL